MSPYLFLALARFPKILSVPSAWRAHYARAVSLLRALRKFEPILDEPPLDYARLTGFSTNQANCARFTIPLPVMINGERLVATFDFAIVYDEESCAWSVVDKLSRPLGPAFLSREEWQQDGMKTLQSVLDESYLYIDYPMRPWSDVMPQMPDSHE